jgi:hypothetical protein
MPAQYIDGNRHLRENFEGIPKPNSDNDTPLPHNLCLSENSCSRLQRPTQVTFDIDSFCADTSSLAVAKLEEIWSRVLRFIAGKEAFSDFHGATLFLNGKNMKLMTMQKTFHEL